jgi:hypothetical protein
MWPANRSDFRDWLDLASDLGERDLRLRLRPFPAVEPEIDSLAARAVAGAARIAGRRWRQRGWFPDFVADRVQFVRWFCELAYREGQRRLLLLSEARTALAGLTPEQQRLLLWLYLNQLTFTQVATILRSDTRAVRLQSREAYRGLRGRLAVRLGENRDAFPLFPAAVGHGF